MRPPPLPPPTLPPPPPRVPKKRRRRSWIVSGLGFLFGSFVVLFLAGSALAGYLLWKASQDLPSYESLAKYEPPVMTRIHAHDGSLIAEYARERRIFVPIHTVPKLVIDAFLSAEDRRFYQHGGLDFTGIGRAAIKFAEVKIKGGGGGVQGASTITQQVAKNFLLTNERTFDRKLREAILAIRIERAYSKDRILELYLNEIYLGIGSYGVAAAALNYFGKELEELSIEEAAYLAALPKAPNNYHPFRRKREALARRNWIIDQMVETGSIKPEAAKAAREKDLTVNIRPFGTQIYAADYFAEEVRRRIIAEFGEEKLYSGGLSVRTTLDPRLQRLARLALIDGLVAFDRSLGGGWRGPIRRFEDLRDWSERLANVQAAGTRSSKQKLAVVLQVRPGWTRVGALADTHKTEPRTQQPSEIQDIREQRAAASRRVRGKAAPAEGEERVEELEAAKPGDVVVVEVGADGTWTLVRTPDRSGRMTLVKPAPGIDATDWGEKLAALDMPYDVQPWQVGVVLAVDRSKAVVGLRPERNPDDTAVQERLAVHVAYDEIKWANRKPGRTPGPADVLSVGDVIWVAPKDPKNVQGAWSLMQMPEVSGGIVAMDPHTGRVMATVGGFSFALSQFDRASQARRQPGSTFKPFVYAAAIDNGYKPTSIVLDAPIEIEAQPGTIWRPENFNRSSSLGPATLRVGIEKSRNQMTARLAQDMGMPLIVEYARRFGIYDDLLPVPAMSLGAGETTLLRMTGAYAMLANGGRQVRTTLIDRVQDRWGRSVWRHDDRECTACKADAWKGQAEPELLDDRKQIMDPHTAYQMTSIMEGVVQRGTATIIRPILGDVPIAGKTGTSNDSKDVWFVGYTPDLVVGVYIGYDTPKPMGKAATGGQIAAPIFANFLKQALAGKRAVPFRSPPGIKLVRVNSKTGLRAQPGESDSILEVFKPSEEPDDPSSVLGFSSENQGAFAPPQSSPASQGAFALPPR